MIKAKTVREFYEGYPERWIQGHSWQDKHGNVTYNKENVTCSCLRSAVYFVYKPQISATYDKASEYDKLSIETIEAENAAEREVLNKIQIVINKYYDGDEYSIIYWNDAIERTFDEVIRVVIEAGV